MFEINMGLITAIGVIILLVTIVYLNRFHFMKNSEDGLK